MTIRAQTAGPTLDIASQIAAVMRRMGVAGLPRNYEIFYEAVTGSNDALNEALAALGDNPPQVELDRISAVHFAENSGMAVVAHAHEQIQRKLDEILKVVDKERSSLENYGRILDETAEGLASRNLVSRDLLEKVLGIMIAATNVTIVQGKQTVVSIEDKSAELDLVKQKLEEYKVLADTDSLTTIWNRRAFDKRLARVYDNPRSVMYSALILLDVDRFKDVNDRFGHPAGDRVLQKVAGVMRSFSDDSTFMARTGGEEFAVIVEATSEDAVFQLADRLRSAISMTDFETQAMVPGYGGITVSAGICMASDAPSPTDLYALADRALYTSKIQGRNCVTRQADAVERKTGKSWMLYRTD